MFARIRASEEPSFRLAKSLFSWSIPFSRERTFCAQSFVSFISCSSRARLSFVCSPEMAMRHSPWFCSTSLTLCRIVAITFFTSFTSSKNDAMNADCAPPPPASRSPAPSPAPPIPLRSARRSFILRYECEIARGLAAARARCKGSAAAAAKAVAADFLRDLAKRSSRRSAAARNSWQMDDHPISWATTSRSTRAAEAEIAKSCGHRSTAALPLHRAPPPPVLAQFRTPTSR